MKPTNTILCILFLLGFIVLRCESHAQSSTSKAADLELKLSRRLHRRLEAKVVNNQTFHTAKGTIPSNLNGTFCIINMHSGKALEAPVGLFWEGLRIFQNDFRGTENQLWKLKFSDGVYSITSSLTRLVIDVEGGGERNFTPIDMWPDEGATNQRWILQEDRNGYVKIRCVRSGKVIDVKNASYDNGAGIIQNQENGSDSQLWKIIPCFILSYEGRQITIHN